MGHGGGAAAAAPARQASQNDRKTSAVGFEPGPLRRRFRSRRLNRSAKVSFGGRFGIGFCGNLGGHGHKNRPKTLPKVIP